MGKEVTLEAIYQAVIELSEQLSQTENRLTARMDKMGSRMDSLENRMDKMEQGLSDQIRQLDTKFSIVLDELYETKADVRNIQRAR